LARGLVCPVEAVGDEDGCDASGQSGRVCIAWSGACADLSSSLGTFHRVADRRARFKACCLLDFTVKAVELPGRVHQF
jgi:hypothetical protein